MTLPVSAYEVSFVGSINADRSGANYGYAATVNDAFTQGISESDTVLVYQNLNSLPAMDSWNPLPAVLLSDTGKLIYKGFSTAFFGGPLSIYYTEDNCDPRCAIQEVQPKLYAASYKIVVIPSAQAASLNAAHIDTSRAQAVETFLAGHGGLTAH